MFSLDETVYCGLVLDLEQDGSMEIIAGDKQGNIHILDALTGEF